MEVAVAVLHAGLEQAEGEVDCVEIRRLEELLEVLNAFEAAG